jgi:hypothetical protein
MLATRGLRQGVHQRVCVDGLAVDERLDDEQGIDCGVVRLITV